MELNLKLKRSKKNPILCPTVMWWENKRAYNAGVLELGNKTHLIYTARGDDEISRLGYARLRSIDEVEECLPYPIFMPQEWFEPDGVEDVRLVAIGDRIFMLYAGKDKDMARVCESHISVADFLGGRWAWSRHRLIMPIMVGIHNRNASPRISWLPV